MVKNKKSRIIVFYFLLGLYFRLKESKEYYILKMIIGKGLNMLIVFDILYGLIVK